MVSATICAPLLVGMDAVALIQLRNPGHVVEQERKEHHALFVRDVAEGLAERGRVLLAEVRRRLHAGENHHGVSLARSLDDRREVLFHLRHRQSAQAVVGAERHNQDPHVAVERPVEPTQTAGGRVAGHAGVDDFEVVAGVVELPLQQRRIGLLLQEAESRGQAVAERDDLSAAPPGHGSRRGGGSRAAGRAAGGASRLAPAPPQASDQDGGEPADPGNTSTAHGVF